MVNGLRCLSWRSSPVKGLSVGLKQTCSWDTQDFSAGSGLLSNLGHSHQLIYLLPFFLPSFTLLPPTGVDVNSNVFVPFNPGLFLFFFFCLLLRRPHFPIGKMNWYLDGYLRHPVHGKCLVQVPVMSYWEPGELSFSGLPLPDCLFLLGSQALCDEVPPSLYHPPHYRLLSSPVTLSFFVQATLASSLFLEYTNHA